MKLIEKYIAQETGNNTPGLKPVWLYEVEISLIGKVDHAEIKHSKDKIIISEINQAPFKHVGELGENPSVFPVGFKFSNSFDRIINFKIYYDDPKETQKERDEFVMDNIKIPIAVANYCERKGLTYDLKIVKRHQLDYTAYQYQEATM